MLQEDIKGNLNLPMGSVFYELKRNEVMALETRCLIIVFRIVGNFARILKFGVYSNALLTELS